eukprot:2876176-Prymnesium_polylepis.1
MRTSDVSTTLTLGRDAQRCPDPQHSSTARAGGTQQSPKALHRSLALRPKAVCESASPGSKR